MLWGPVILLGLYAVLGCLAMALHTIFNRRRHYLRWFALSLLPLIIFFFGLAEAPSMADVNQEIAQKTEQNMSIPSVNVDSMLEKPKEAVKPVTKTPKTEDYTPSTTTNKTEKIDASAKTSEQSKSSVSEKNQTDSQAAKTNKPGSSVQPVQSTQSTQTTQPSQTTSQPAQQASGTQTKQVPSSSGGWVQYGNQQIKQ